MKKYRIKIGNLYVRSIWVADDYVKTYFIKGIDLRAEKSMSDYTVKEEDIEEIKDILMRALELMARYEITFEEVEEEKCLAH